LFNHGKVDRGDFYPLHHLVAEAEQLARAMPPGELRDHYLSVAGQLMEKVNALNPFAAMMNLNMAGAFEQMADLDDADDDDIDEIDW
jgi:hypothetical protein